LDWSLQTKIVVARRRRLIGAGAEAPAHTSLNLSSHRRFPCERLRLNALAPTLAVM
jgi:hypothetical protein